MRQTGQTKNAALSEEELYYTDMTVGDILRRAREHYGQSLPDIEQALHIRLCQIEAIETGEFDKLPGKVYAIGFVRTYAEYLGLDGHRMVQLFKVQYAGKTVDPELHFPAAASETKLPSKWLLLFCLILAVLIFSGWWAMNDRDRSIVSDLPSVSEAFRVEKPVYNSMDSSLKDPVGEAVESAVDETVKDSPVVTSFESAQFAIAAPQENSLAALPVVEGQEDMGRTEKEVTSSAIPVPRPPQRKGITLNVLRNSWVEIKDQSGKLLLSRVLEAGDRYYVPNRPDLTISLGNAAGVQLEVDGVTLKPLGRAGDVLKNLPLDSKYLKEKFKAKKR